MRGLHIEPMTKVTRGGGGSTSIRVDAREFNMAMRDAEKVIADAMFRGSGRAFDQTKRETDRYLRSLTFQTPQAKKVADSLDYTKGSERKPEIRGDDITLEAMFGSRGPRIHGGEIGFGVHTSPDDNGGTFNIGQAVEEGISPRKFSFRASPGAKEHGRQIGRAKGPTAWYGKGGSADFIGIQGTEYISHAANFFNRIIKKEVERQLVF